MHSHQIGGVEIKHHDHIVLDKIARAVKKTETSDSNQEMIQFQKFEHIKLMIQEKPSFHFVTTGQKDIHLVQLSKDQVYHKLPSPPPKCNEA